MACLIGFFTPLFILLVAVCFVNRGTDPLHQWNTEMREKPKGDGKNRVGKEKNRLVTRRKRPTTTVSLSTLVRPRSMRRLRSAFKPCEQSVMYLWMRSSTKGKHQTKEDLQKETESGYNRKKQSTNEQEKR